MNHSLFFVDVEAVGPCPSQGKMTDFGAAHLQITSDLSLKSKVDVFYGQLFHTVPGIKNPAIPVITGVARDPYAVFHEFREWIEGFGPHRPMFISDNPAYDWQWINDGFHIHLGENPFGHSARRIGDFWAGLQGNFSDHSSWKKLRQTRHDHNPVNDAVGNAEAFVRMFLAGIKVPANKL